MVPPLSPPCSVPGAVNFEGSPCPGASGTVGQWEVQKSAQLREGEEIETEAFFPPPRTPPPNTRSQVVECGNRPTTFNNSNSPVSAPGSASSPCPSVPWRGELSDVVALRFFTIMRRPPSPLSTPLQTANLLNSPQVLHSSR